jgi:hypothetical protein
MKIVPLTYPNGPSDRRPGKAVMIATANFTLSSVDGYLQMHIHKQLLKPSLGILGQTKFMLQNFLFTDAHIHKCLIDDY